MAKQRPIDFPKWATGGINILPDYTPPLSEGAGYIPEQKPPSIDWNTIWHRNDTWVEYYDENIPHIKDIAGLANSNRHGLTTLTYQTGGGSLTSPATPGGVYWIDGVRVELDISRLTKLGQLNHDFNPNQDTYISITGSTETTLVFTEVPNGDPAPAPPAGFTNIVVVESDALEVTFVTQLLTETVSTLFPYYFETLCSGERCEFQPVTNVNNFAGIFLTTGSGDAVYAQANGSGIGVNVFSFGSAPALRARHAGVNQPAGEFIGTLGAYTLKAIGLSGGLEASTINGTAVDARVSGTGASNEAVNAVAVGSAAGIRSTSVNGIGCEVTTTGSGAAGVFSQSGVGFGLLVQSANSVGINAQSVTNLAINAIGGNGCIDAFAVSGTCLDAESGNGLAINAVGTNGCIVANASSGIAVRAIADDDDAIRATTINGIGVFGSGLDGGIVGEPATNNSGIGVLGRTTALAFLTSCAVKGEALDEGCGGKFESVDGYGVEIETTGTARAALRMDPQAADPASAFTGDVWFRTTGPKFRLGTDNRFFWGTPAGMQMAKKVQTANEFIPSASSSDVLLSTITVPVGSSIMVVAKARLKIPAGDTVSMQLRKDFANILGLTETINNPSASTLFTTWTVTEFVNGPVVAGISIYASVGAGSTVDVEGCQMTLLGTFKTTDITTL